MSFRVDGVSLAACREWAKKATPAAVRRGGIEMPLTEAEWLARAEEAAIARFASAKPSPLKTFATPQAMEQFVAMCGPDEVRGLRKMALFDTGRRDRATGEAVTVWREYGGSAEVA